MRPLGSPLLFPILLTRPILKNINLYKVQIKRILGFKRKKRVGFKTEIRLRRGCADGLRLLYNFILAVASGRGCARGQIGVAAPIFSRFGGEIKGDKSGV